MSDQNIGKFYAVGVGPGDPDLLTRKAYQILSEVEVIWAPIARTSEESYSLTIINQALDPLQL